MGTERVAAQLLISGIVQGVGYRYWTTRTAARLGLAGWVRNLYDDRVEIFAEGPAPALEALVTACREGPRSAEVTDVARNERPPQGLSGFEARATAAAPEP
ncbi:MAG: acylphosphatase [Alphaproteobacteria bacterium]|nr:acylphosphatase [Alphaproteobacteria bacterium]